MLLLSAFFSFVCAQGLVRGLPLEQRIVGGQGATINEAPYQAALLFYNPTTDTFNHNCGGSIIKLDVILSAAHCVNGTNPYSWRIRVGSTYHNSGGTVTDISRYYKHSSYNSDFDYDIVLLFLPAKLHQSTVVNSIKLPIQGEAVVTGASAFVTGWGVLSEGGPKPVQLQKITVPIVNSQQCVNIYSTFNPVTTRMICAGRLGIGGQDACQDDSGGPMVINKKLVGIVSWGLGCARPDYPGVYTRVSQFANWIDTNIKAQA